jgi:hypothetical protein
MAIAQAKYRKAQQRGKQASPNHLVTHRQNFDLKMQAESGKAQSNLQQQKAEG